jgi:parallel beta-helix repeat protein
MALANAGDGVRLQNGAASNTIGGTAGGSFNIISGNAGNGITITGIGSNDNTIVSNDIGTGSGTGSANANGVVIENGATGNKVGIPGSGTNLISGNTGDGVFIQGNGNTVTADVIGADVSGLSGLPNGHVGVEIDGSNNVVGDAYHSSVVQESIIAFNGSDGVSVDSGTGNTVLANLIFSNGALGIALQSGANNNAPAPTLSPVTTSGGVSTITGTLHGAASTAYLIEWFSSPTGTGGQGQTNLGFALVMTDSTGMATISFKTSASLSGQFVTATATDSAGNTSEFSSAIPG